MDEQRAIKMEQETRRPNIDDSDDLAKIMCTAFPDDPQWDYRFPSRRQYPEEHLKCTRRMLEGFLADADGENTMVRVVTDRGLIKRPGPPRPIALAVWKFEYIHSQSLQLRGLTQPRFLGCSTVSRHSNMDEDDCANRRDASPRRMQAFEQSLKTAKMDFFDCRYGHNQLHLLILGTLPKYRRQGAGTRLCEWGMQIGRERNLPVTLFGSPMGQQLYLHLGFENIGIVTVQVQGDDEKPTIHPMCFQ